MAEGGGGGLVERRRVVGLDRAGELTHLFAANLEALGIVMHHSQDVGFERHLYASFAVAVARPKIFLPPVVADNAMTTDLASGVDGLDPSVEDDLGADAVVGHGHHGGEAHVVLGHRGRVADPGRDVAATQAHGQHAVGDRGVQTDLLGDLVVPVDRVQVTGYAGVVDQVHPRQGGNDTLRQLVTDLDRAELT